MQLEVVRQLQCEINSSCSSVLLPVKQLQGREQAGVFGWPVEKVMVSTWEEAEFVQVCVGG